ncbi:MAG: MSCRAMM family adhesin SdrC, partial [Lachnospiraceae bacterium]|nr:MSCRAMM family adhesin SdrC [Lachnospiraceae bacterium]
MKKRKRTTVISGLLLASLLALSVPAAEAKCMRIQHNIRVMNSLSQDGTDRDALASETEKLSGGYRVTAKTERSTGFGYFRVLMKSAGESYSLISRDTWTDVSGLLDEIWDENVWNSSPQEVTIEELNAYGSSLESVTFELEEELYVCSGIVETDGTPLPESVSLTETLSVTGADLPPEGETEEEPEIRWQIDAYDESGETVVAYAHGQTDYTASFSICDLTYDSGYTMGDVASVRIRLEIDDEEPVEATVNCEYQYQLVFSGDAALLPGSEAEASYLYDADEMRFYTESDGTRSYADESVLFYGDLDADFTDEGESSSVYAALYRNGKLYTDAEIGIYALSEDEVSTDALLLMADANADADANTDTNTGTDTDTGTESEAADTEGFVLAASLYNTDLSEAFVENITESLSDAYPSLTEYPYVLVAKVDGEAVAVSQITYSQESDAVSLEQGEAAYYYCPNCEEVTLVSHEAACGEEGHYTCDGRGHDVYYHDTAYGAHSTCMGEVLHLCTSCNTYESCSDFLAHETVECHINEHCAGDGLDHSAAACGTDGHYNCDGEDHSDADCGIDGHKNCDGLDHSEASCGVEGHTNCDGLDHSEASCGVEGHTNCDGEDHSSADCGTDGHYNCDGSDHSAADCGTDGHYNCDGSDHSAADCGTDGHYNCDG